MTIELAYSYLFWTALFVLTALLLVCLVRAIIGPRVADRLVAVNMMGTIVIVIIAIMAFVLKESYLLDIALIYVMVSFLAVAMLSKVYIGISVERAQRKEREDAE